MTTEKFDYTSVTRPATVRLIQHSGDDKMVVDAARISLRAEDIDDINARDIMDALRETFAPSESRELTERDKRLIKYLADHKHMSPFEHNHMTFWIEAPMFIRSQHMRHRTWSYNEVSRRYTSEKIRIYEPEHVRPQAETNRQASKDEPFNPVISEVHGKHMVWPTTLVEDMRGHHALCVKRYQQYLSVGCAREVARGVLPMNTMTQYYATVNLRNAAAFIRERCAQDAQTEMRYLADQIRAVVCRLYPVAAAHLLGD